MLCRILHDESPSLITDHRLLTTALRRHLPDHAAASVARSFTAGDGGAVHIALAVEGHAAERRVAVVAEAVQRLVGPVTAAIDQAEDSAIIVVAAAQRGAVEIPVATHGHAGEGVHSFALGKIKEMQ